MAFTKPSRSRPNHSMCFHEMKQETGVSFVISNVLREASSYISNLIEMKRRKNKSRVKHNIPSGIHTSCKRKQNNSWSMVMAKASILDSWIHWED